MLHDTPYATVHVGIVIEDPDAYPATEVLDHLKGTTTTSDACVILDGDGFTEWGEPREEWDQSPLHATVILERPSDEHGEAVDDITPYRKREARRVYADRARAAVLSLLPSGRYRLADYVAVDLTPVWGEDSEVIGLWA